MQHDLPAAETTQAERVTTVLAWPARRNAEHNPYQKLLYDAVEGTGRCRVIEFGGRTALARPAPDILHIHWPDAFLAAGAGWRFWPRWLGLRLYLALMRLRGTKLVWTVHNLRRDGQRNGARMGRWFWPWFLRRLDGVIFMTEASAQRAAGTEPALIATPSTVIPHGHYGPILPPAEPDTPPALPEAVFFGSITRYKNADRLVESFLQLPPGSARLTICGRMSDREPDTRLEALLADLPRDRADELRFDNRFLSDDDLAAAIRAADLAVFPYTDVLNSGAAIFALSAGRPILASDIALFRELQDQVGKDWVMLIDGSLDGLQLQAALSRARQLRSRGAAPDLSAFDWEPIARRMIAFYASLGTPGNGTA